MNEHKKCKQKIHTAEKVKLAYMYLRGRAVEQSIDLLEAAKVRHGLLHLDEVGQRHPQLVAQLSHAPGHRTHALL